MADRIVISPSRPVVRVVVNGIPTGAYASTADVTAAVAAHASDPDAHGHFLTQAEGDAAYDALGAAAAVASDTWQWVSLLGTHTTTSATPSAMAGVTFTPVAGKTYIVQWWASSTGAVTTTGTVIEVQPGNTATGSALISTMGTGATATTTQRGSLVGGNVVTSTTNNGHPTSPAEALDYGLAIFVADATAPTPFSLYAGSEVGGSSISVTRCVLAYLQVD